MTDVNIIRMFWHGEPPGLWEQLSIRSFLAQGHRVEVHAYTDMPLPAGAVLVDAAQTLPASQVFTYARGRGKGSFAAFANQFRYKLLHERGGTWSDCDMLCLRPFNDLPPVCVGRESPQTVNNGLLRFPAGHPLTAALYEQAAHMGSNILWGEAGPKLLTRLLADHSDVVVLPANAFYPMHWRDAWRLIKPDNLDECTRLTAGSHAVHWWNEMLRRFTIPKDRLPPEESWLGQQATTLLGEVPRWSAVQIDQWINGYDAQILAKPLQRFLQGQLPLPHYLVACADVSDQSGMTDKAIELLDTAHRLWPGDPAARLRLASILLRLGRTGEAAPHLQAALADPRTREHAQKLQAGRLS